MYWESTDVCANNVRLVFPFFYTINLATAIIWSINELMNNFFFIKKLYVTWSLRLRDKLCITTYYVVGFCHSSKCLTNCLVSIHSFLLYLFHRVDNLVDSLSDNTYGKSWESVLVSPRPSLFSLLLAKIRFPL